MTPLNLSKLTQALVLAAIAAALAAPTLALGGSTPAKPAPDVFERYAAAHPYGAGTPWATQAPDVFERYAAAHPYGAGVLGSTQALTVDGRSPDTLDAAQATQLQTIDGRSPDTLEAAAATQLQVADGRSPDTLEAASAPQPIEIVQPGGFDWADAGIGAIVATLITLLIAGTMLLLARFNRRQRIRAT
jgi:hypothetical protein